jgi:hypothetical protein
MATHLDTGTWVLLVAVTAFVAVVAFRVSARFGALHGVTPWRIPSWGWALLALLPPLLCLVLLFVAVRTTRVPQTAVPIGPRGTEAFGPGMEYLPPRPVELAPAGWYPDPSGRYLTRYWDGRTWGDQVHDGVAVASDPPAG